MVEIGVCGAAGRMGKAIIKVCQRQEVAAKLVAAIDAPDSELIGIDAGEQAGLGRIGVPIVSAIDQTTDDFNVLINFTPAHSALDSVNKCHTLGKPIVIGTTGLTLAQQAEIKAAAEDIAIVFAPNMSIGINLCFKLLALATQVLGQDADIEIIEAHHRDKCDAPSGTALHMGEVVATSLGRTIQQCAIYERKGIIGKRNRDTISFATIRAGDIVGEHTVMFASTGERVEITHRATSREIFAKGAVTAAQWLSNRAPGLYDMQDVLGLKQMY